VAASVSSRQTVGPRRQARQQALPPAAAAPLPRHQGFAGPVNRGWRSIAGSATLRTRQAATGLLRRELR